MPFSGQGWADSALWLSGLKDPSLRASDFSFLVSSQLLCGKAGHRGQVAVPYVLCGLSFLFYMGHICPLCLFQSLALSLSPHLLLPVLACFLACKTVDSADIPHRVIVEVKVVKCLVREAGLAAGASPWTPPALTLGFLVPPVGSRRAQSPCVVHPSCFGVALLASSLSLPLGRHLPV